MAIAVVVNVLQLLKDFGALFAVVGIFDNRIEVSKFMEWYTFEMYIF